MTVCIIALLLWAPSVVAQPPTLVLNDAQGDTVDRNGAPGQGAPWADIHQFNLYEDLIDDALTFEFVVGGDLPPFDQFRSREMNYQVHLLINGEERRLGVHIYDDDVRWVAQTSYEEPYEDPIYSPRPIWGGPAEIIPGGTIRGTIPRTVFLDVGGVHIGSKLEQLFVTSISLEQSVGTGESRYGLADNRDRVPDAGTIDHAISFHATPAPDLLLFSEQMVKSSNGGATTLVFPVKIHGNATDIHLATSGVPDEWDVDVPIDHIPRLEGEIIVPLILTARFQHQHGVSQLFEVTATASQGTARANYGIHYLEYPQPAGHHPRLFIHAISNGAQTFGATGGYVTPDASHRLIMSARGEHPFAEAAPAPADGGPFVDEAEGEWTWEIPLDPRLRIGLHPSGETGTFSFAMQRGFGGTVSVNGTLGVLLGGEMMPLWAIGAVEVDLASGEEIEAPITSIIDSALPYVDGSNLVLHLRAIGGAPGPRVGPDDLVYLQPGAVLDLPIREYHESILNVIGPSNLTVLGDGREIEVRPASSTVHMFGLRNGGDVPLDVNVALQASDGVQVELERTRYPLKAGEKIDLDVIIHAPREGSFVLAIAASTPDGEIAIGRAFFSVSESAPEGQPYQGPAKHSPNVALAAVLALLVALSVAHSRHPQEPACKSEE